MSKLPTAQELARKWECATCGQYWRYARSQSRLGERVHVDPRQNTHQVKPRN